MAAEGGRLRRARAWVVRAGENGEYVEHNLRNGVATFAWDQLPDLGTYANIEELKDDIDVLTPGLEANRRKIGNHAGQLWRFRTEIKLGDIVVLPLNDRSGNQHVAIGTVTGLYQFDAAQEPGTLHRIPVEWLDTKIHICALDDELREWIRKKTRGTVRQIGAIGAADRLAATAVPPLSGDEAGARAADGLTVPEGSTKRVEVNRYERNSWARSVCLEHYGHRCQVCDVDFEERYGELGRGYMHVHHVIPLHQVAKIPNYRVDPIKDLRPVCPNCHAMLHRRKHRTLTVEELRELLPPE
ncbi:HNH endonuclease [Candidatus Poriferisodalis sp.]|uniref:HNH endonuclease n=1 Tax=Candidatus Poriferisodalis sp. TaxID=3101277 RepID=UPI003B02589A